MPTEPLEGTVNDDLGEQLRRLGLSRGAKDLQPRAPKRARAIEALIPGEIVHSNLGPFFLRTETYSPGYQHGHLALGTLLAHPPEQTALLARDERLAEVDFQRMAFVDTETTGLAGGTGTYAFLIGVGLFEGEQFTLYQFFMRDYDEEPAQIEALGKVLDRAEAIVSFNGKSFDMPLLETRFIMTRQMPRLLDAPHLDLLLPARRFWKWRLKSCALSSLENHVLGVERTQEDVPGWLIPSLYVDYAQSGDAGEMPRIFYHNAQDILSLVTLTAQMCDLLRPSLLKEGQVPGEDVYGLARLFQDLGQLDRAEAAFAQAIRTCQMEGIRAMAQRDLAYLLKRQERREEALPLWQQLAETSSTVYAFEELAKHYEWQDEDLSLAIDWTRQGIAQASAWPPGLRRNDTLAELEHRLERLERKRNAADPTVDAPPGS